MGVIVHLSTRSSSKMMGKGVYFKRELISDNIKNVYPISFAIPKEKIVHTINPKPLNIFSSVNTRQVFNLHI